MNKPTTVCALCNNPPEIPCPTCQDTQPLYCSSDCLTCDHPIHKLVCASFATLPAKLIGGEGGGAKHVLGVLFPSSSPDPELVWVRIGGFTDEESGISFQEAEVGDFLQVDSNHNGVPAPESLHSERNRLRNRDTRSMLEIWHVKSDKLAENLCVKTLAATTTATTEEEEEEEKEGKPFYNWRGSILIIFMTRSTGFMIDPGLYRDCQLQDFRDAVDFVVDYGNDVHDRRVQEALDTLGTTTTTTNTGTGSQPEVLQEKEKEKEETAAGRVEQQQQEEELLSKDNIIIAEMSG